MSICDPLLLETSKTLSTSADPVKTFDWVTLLQPFIPDAFANGFSTLVGALVGAMLAYLLQRELQKKQDYKLALVSAHRVIFSLLQQINTIILIQKDYVFTHINNPGRYISICPTLPYDLDKYVLVTKDLTFLLESSDGRAILYELQIAQENYIEAIKQWNMRSELHFKDVQPALASAGVVPGKNVTANEIENALGILLHETIVSSTDNCLITLKRAFNKLTTCKDNFRKYAVSRFKTNDFTDFSYPDTFGLASEDESKE